MSEPTQTAPTPTFAEQVVAVDALTEMRKTFSHLPGVTVYLSDACPTRVNITLFGQDADFEAWREALGIPAAGVELRTARDDLSVLAAEGTFSGASVRLSGHVIPTVAPRPAEGGERR